MALNGGEPFWVKEEDVAVDRHFIFDLKVGRSSLPIDVGHGFECISWLKSMKTNNAA